MTYPPQDYYTSEECRRVDQRCSLIVATMLFVMVAWKCFH